MIEIIKKGSTNEDVNKRLEALNKNLSKGFKASEFCGILKLDQDPLALQKRLRSEWE